MLVTDVTGSILREPKAFLPSAEISAQTAIAEEARRAEGRARGDLYADVGRRCRRDAGRVRESAPIVVLKGARPEGKEAEKIANELRAWAGKEIGPIAKPTVIRFREDLPKTRSGKIMRRWQRSLAAGEEITRNVSTLENPAILDQLCWLVPASVLRVGCQVSRRAYSSILRRQVA
jgi:acyl-CoA synthetase (AMP-forming)/AMP-acid ligase II